MPANAQPTDFIVGKCELNCLDGGVCEGVDFCERVVIDSAVVGACFDQSVSLPMQAEVAHPTR
jgi:hypothetical protein